MPPVTCRAWFRKMRAADFERDQWKCIGNVASIRINGVEQPKVWTLFDTQAVVEQVTAATYLTVDPYLELPDLLGIGSSLWYQ